MIGRQGTNQRVSMCRIVLQSNILPAEGAGFELAELLRSIVFRTIPLAKIGSPSVKWLRE